MEFLAKRTHIEHILCLILVIMWFYTIIMFVGCKTKSDSSREFIENTIRETSVGILNGNENTDTDEINGLGNINQVYNNASYMVQCGRRIYFIIPTNSNKLNMDIGYYDILTQKVIKIEGTQFSVDDSFLNFEPKNEKIHISAGYIYIEGMVEKQNNSEGGSSKTDGVIRISPIDLSVKFYADAEVLMAGSVYMILHFNDADSDCIYNGNEEIYNIEKSMFYKENKFEASKNQIVAVQNSYIYYIISYGNSNAGYNLVALNPESLETRTICSLLLRNATQFWIKEDKINLINYEDDTETCYKYSIDMWGKESSYTEELKKDVITDTIFEDDTLILESLDDNKKNVLKDKIAVFRDIECVYDDLDDVFICYDCKAQTKEEIVPEVLS